MSSSKDKVKSPAKTPDKETKKTSEKRSSSKSSSRNSTITSTINDSTERGSREARDEKFSRILQNLQTDQLPSLRMKLRFEEEALKLMRAAFKSNRLSVIDLSGPGLVDATAKDLCTLIERSQLTYLGIHGHDYTPTGLGGVSNHHHILFLF